MPVGLVLSDYFIYPISTDKIEQIAFIGGLDWLPNQEGLEWFITKVWHKILNIHPNAELHIAGRNCDDNLQTQIKTFKMLFLW